MFKKLLFSIGIIFLVGSTSAGATFALLQSNPVTLAQNQFNTGSVNIQIARDDSDWSDTSVTGFSGTLRPGETKSFFVSLKNKETDISLRISALVPTPTLTGGVTGGDVKLKFTPVDGSGTPTGDPTTVHTLTVYGSPQNFPASDLLPPSGQQRYKMDVSMDDGVTTQGTVNFDVIFTGTQTITPTPTP